MGKKIIAIIRFFCLTGPIFSRKVIFLSIGLNMNLDAQKNRLLEPSFEHPHYMFLLRNKKTKFKQTLLSEGMLTVYHKSTCAGA